jgi:hypothetical protein
MEFHSEIAMIIVVASGLKVFDATCPLVTKVHGHHFVIVHLAALAMWKTPAA